MIARIATVEIPATHVGHCAFVGVYPPLPDKHIQEWRVRKFEIPETLVDKYFGEQQLVDSQLVLLDTLEQVEELLTNWQLDSAAFEAPWKNNYPL